LQKSKQQLLLVEAVGAVAEVLYLAYSAELEQ
jgi:hypothetical protein